MKINGCKTCNFKNNKCVCLLLFNNNKDKNIKKYIYDDFLFSSECPLIISDEGNRKQMKTGYGHGGMSYQGA